MLILILWFFFFNDPAPTEIYTLSLHDALPILHAGRLRVHARGPGMRSLRLSGGTQSLSRRLLDRKSTRLNSSHVEISYAVFCLKKKKNTDPHSFQINTNKTRPHIKHVSILTRY